MAKLIRFPSGLAVCYERKKSALSCAFGIYVGAGSRDEKKDENGVAHFIEHMLFKGTEKRTAFDIANEIDRLGANANAYTSKSNTVYYVSGLAKFLPQYMDVLSDMLFNSTFTDENTEKERGVVLEEIKMYDDDGDSVCADLLAEKYFGKNPLARPILGTEKSVKSLNREKILSFMERNYVPENIALSYAGPASEEELNALVEHYFEKRFVSQSGKFRAPVRRNVATNAFYVTRCDKPFEQANVMIRFPSYTIKNKKADAVLMLGIILGGGMSSRLFQKVREERGLVYEIYCSATAVKGTGYLDIGFATAPALAEQAIAAVREVIEEVREKGLEKDEFEKVKIQRETGAVLGGETTFDIMRLMGKYYLLTGRPVTYRSLVKKMEKMTVSDVTDAFNDIIDYDKAGICYVGKPVEVDLGKLFRSGGI